MKMQCQVPDIGVNKKSSDFYIQKILKALDISIIVIYSSILLFRFIIGTRPACWRKYLTIQAKYSNFSKSTWYKSKKISYKILCKSFSAV